MLRKLRRLSTLMTENLIKSADRVKDHGEVFTPRRIVNLMLDQPEIAAKINDLYATFLEPSAGEGAFLTELVSRKMKVALEKSSSAKEYGINCLIALSSLYGIELLEDNVEVLVMNMNDTFRDEYRQQIGKSFNDEPDQKVLKSAKVIIRANMAQGDALKRTTSDGSPIIFSEWASTKRQDYVQRTEYTFDAIVEGAAPTGTVSGSSEQLNLFALDESPTEDKQIRYAPCEWINIYKEKLA